MAPAGPLELPLFELIPSQKQVVFHGDRLPFQCTATYLDITTEVNWYHGGRLVETDDVRGMFVEDSIIHDCSLITRELIMSSIDIDATGMWECVVNNSYGSISKQVEIVVLKTAVPYCPAERIINNKGDFRWPKTMAGVTAYHSCLQYSLSSTSFWNGAGELKAWRRCNHTGWWTEESYSKCPDSQDVIQVLYAFSQLADAIIEIASNIMLVDDHVLWKAQKESKACARIVQCVEQISSLTLSSNTQDISKVFLEMYSLVKLWPEGMIREYLKNLSHYIPNSAHFITSLVCFSLPLL